MGELIDMKKYFEKKVGTLDPEQIRARIAQIAVEIVLLESESRRLEFVLRNLDSKPTDDKGLT